MGTRLRSLVEMVFRRSKGTMLTFARTLINYKSEVGNPLASSLVGAVVGWMSRNFPEAPVRVTRKTPAGEVETFASGGMFGVPHMIRLLERPNPFFSGAALWMATIVDFVQGDAYWVKTRSGTRVTGLWWVPARFLEPRWPEDDPTVFISHYELQLDGEVQKLDPRDVIHFRNGINPANIRKGNNVMDSLWRELFTDHEAAAFTATLLRNLGVPGVTISPANTTGSLKGDPEEIKRRFMDKTQGDARGEPMVFTVPTEVRVLSFSPQAMDLKALRRIPEERVAAVLGVPAGVAQLGAGLDRNTFSNYGEANRAAHTQCLIPMGRLFAADLEVQLLGDFVELDGEDEWDVFFDWAVTEAMAEAAEAIWKRFESAATKGLVKRSEFRAAVGLPFDDADEVYVIPQNYVVSDGAIKPPPAAPRPIATVGGAGSGEPRPAEPEAEAAAA